MNSSEGLNYIIITHNGNVDLNLGVICNDLNYNGNCITKDNQKWKISDEYGTSTQCSGITQIVSGIWSKGTYPTSASVNLYFWLDIPAQISAGDYTGTTTVTVSKT